jgi:hypothetical protein
VLCIIEASNLTAAVFMLLPGEQIPTYIRPGLALFSVAKNESLAMSPGGGNWWAVRSNSPRIWSW